MEARKRQLIVALNTIIHALQQVERAVYWQLVVPFKTLNLFPVKGLEHDQVLVQRLYIGAGKQGNRCIENGTSVEVTVRAHIRASACKANPQWCFTSKDHNWLRY